MFYFLNKNIKYLRNKNNFTQQELAYKLNITISALQKMESGNRNGSIYTLDLLKKIFDISLDELIYTDLSIN